MSNYQRRLFPGMWRPQYHFEQIAWVRPPWPSEEFLWLDMPEAIFTDQGLLYLSHKSPFFPAVFSDELKTIKWHYEEGMMFYERMLPMGVSFGINLKTLENGNVSLSLFIENKSDDALGGINLQTCTFLRGIKEFSDFSPDNKFVYTMDHKLISINEALDSNEDGGKFHIGWREGLKGTDLPVIICKSTESEKLIGVSWFDDTYSLISNGIEPSIHADPFFDDLLPGARSEIKGEIFFYEGKITNFKDVFIARYEEMKKA